MNAIIVSVDYHDLLELTLPYNRHHFEQVMVVTAPHDLKTLQAAVANCCRTYITEVFYRNGAIFNKWAALEEGLSELGRDGWICVMDADVFWPKRLPGSFNLQIGKLYSPLRRMCPDLKRVPEKDWGKFPIHRNVGEWAGYTQIFHAADPVLEAWPWYDLNWKHAGGADSFFQKRWALQNKVRPGWEVLHIGPAGTNWCGRTFRYRDGSIPELASQRQKALDQIFADRRQYHNFDREKLS